MIYEKEDKPDRLGSRSATWQTAEDAGVQDMTLDEVNAIIKDVREKDSDKGEASEMAQADTDKL